MGKRLMAVMMSVGIAAAVTGCGNEQEPVSKVSESNEPIMTMASGQLQEGTHYFKYDNIMANQDANLAQADVVEFFSYGCHHCQEFAPELKDWNKQNPSKKVSYVPVVWNQTTGLYARVYYAIEPLNNFDEVHHEMFKLFETFGHEKSLGEQLDKIYAMLEEKSVDVAAVKARVESKELEDKLRNSIELSKHYEISGTPTLIIEGARRVNNKALTSKDDFFTFVDQLIEM
ncbi:DsbA family protein [Litoribrevibacter euphylliae]|uniref:DsbA family protein n=1 Tax=Litoribrevibacter euphylliae TaxID=1834034 RepID=A0ABV7HG34_9GAMM